MDITLYTVIIKDGGERFDTTLSKLLNISRSAAVRLIESGDALVGGKPAHKSTLLASGDEIEYVLAPPEPSEAQAEDIKLDIIYEDDDIIVINKPAGMVVHPAAGNKSGTLVNALLAHCGDSLSGIGGKIRPGIVHRLDKDTSGLIVVAKNDESHVFLSNQLKTHNVSRVYYAIALGKLQNETGTIEGNIGRHPNKRKQMAVITDDRIKSRPAVTHYKCEKEMNGMSLLRLSLETGRTHQIRVHLSHIGHPILGDTLYGGERAKAPKRLATLHAGQFLCAAELSLTHPKTKEVMSFKIDLPDWFREAEKYYSEKGL
jgi:23S rRNA pseudouridine1911/1915/1917 synthase